MTTVPGARSVPNVAESLASRPEVPPGLRDRILDRALGCAALGLCALDIGAGDPTTIYFATRVDELAESAVAQNSLLYAGLTAAGAFAGLSARAMLANSQSARRIVVGIGDKLDQQGEQYKEKVQNSSKLGRVAVRVGHWSSPLNFISGVTGLVSWAGERAANGAERLTQRISGTRLRGVGKFTNGVAKGLKDMAWGQAVGVPTAVGISLAQEGELPSRTRVLTSAASFAAVWVGMKLAAETAAQYTDQVSESSEAAGQSIEFVSGMLDWSTLQGKAAITYVLGRTVFDWVQMTRDPGRQPSTQ